MLALARAAGAAVAEMYGRGVPVEYKGPRDPVTAADRRANRLLVEGLARAFPGIPVVAEESAPAAFAGFREVERAFFVDPLDGTREFIEGTEEFAVMIGLAERGAAVAGVVLAPLPGVAWTGAVGLGAWRIDPRAAGRAPLRVTATGDLAAARLVVSRSHRSARLERTVAALGAREVGHMGSAGLKGARVAEGLADAYVDAGAGTKKWDACAVDALVTAAGGRVSDLAGAPLDYRSPSLANERGLVVSNGLTHAAILARLGAAGLA